MHIAFYPTEEELTALEATDSSAISIYHSFPLLIDWRERWKIDMLALLRKALDETELSHQQRDELYERVAEQLEPLSLSRASVALFVSSQHVFLYNTFSEVTPALFVGEGFSLVQLLRTISNPREGCILFVGKDDWSLWRFSGPEAPLLVDIDKSGISSLGDFTEEVTSKHIVQRSKNELMAEHTRRYAKSIADAVRNVLAGEHLLVAGDSSLVHDVMQHFPHARGLDKNANSLHVDDIAHEFLDELYREQLQSEFQNLSDSFSSGLTMKDLSDFAAAVADSNVERVFVRANYEESGTVIGREISFEGHAPLVSSLVLSARDSGAEVHVVKEGELTHEFWNNKLVAQRRWAYLG